MMGNALVVRKKSLITNYSPKNGKIAVIWNSDSKNINSHRKK